MRGTFFAYLGLSLLSLLALYGAWLVLHAFWTVLSDLWQQRELDALAAEYMRKRDDRKHELATRLDNGCQHVFNDPLGALPVDVCVHCGLATERPLGSCDHVWRILEGPIPRSECEKCGDLYCSVQEVS